MAKREKRQFDLATAIEELVGVSRLDERGRLQLLVDAQHRLNNGDAMAYFDYWLGAVGENLNIEFPGREDETMTAIERLLSDYGPDAGIGVVGCPNTDMDHLAVIYGEPGGLGFRDLGSLLLEAHETANAIADLLREQGADLAPVLSDEEASDGHAAEVFTSYGLTTRRLAPVAKIK